MAKVIADIGDVSVRVGVSGFEVVLIREEEPKGPTYFVAHPDGSYTEADPQPTTPSEVSALLSEEQVQSLLSVVSHFLVTR